MQALWPYIATATAGKIILERSETPADAEKFDHGLIQIRPRSYTKTTTVLYKFDHGLIHGLHLGQNP